MNGERDLSELHPGPVEIEQYLRGRLEPGHAAAILAHTTCCRTCSVILGGATARVFLPTGTPPRGLHRAVR